MVTQAEFSQAREQASGWMCGAVGGEGKLTPGQSEGWWLVSECGFPHCELWLSRLRFNSYLQPCPCSAAAMHALN